MDQVAQKIKGVCLKELTQMLIDSIFDSTKYCLYEERYI